MKSLHFQDFYYFFIQYALLLVSISIHESSHAWTAFKFGDPTAKMQNRISINPANHIDILGTVIIPFMAFLSGIPLIGWAKPTPVNPNNLRNPYRDGMYVSGAGPISNLLIVLVLVAAWYMLLFAMPNPGRGALIALSILRTGIVLNIILAVFNMLPIHPLDGSGVLEGLLPRPWAEAYSRMRPYGFIILLVLFYTRGFQQLVGTVITFLTRILGIPY